jgi:hypothetical protein
LAQGASGSILQKALTFVRLTLLEKIFYTRSGTRSAFPPARKILGWFLSYFTNSDPLHMPATKEGGVI